MCTRVVYQGTNANDPHRKVDGLERGVPEQFVDFPDAAWTVAVKPGNNPVLWKSKYGSVIASAYDICSTDGMNERGLVATCFGWPNPPIRNGAAPNRD